MADTETPFWCSFSIDHYHNPFALMKWKVYMLFKKPEDDSKIERSIVSNRN